MTPREAISRADPEIARILGSGPRSWIWNKTPRGKTHAPARNATASQSCVFSENGSLSKQTQHNQHHGKADPVAMHVDLAIMMYLDSL